MASVKFNVRNEELRHLRNERRLSQNDVAKKLHLSKNAYAKLENGETKLTLERIIKIAEIFNMEIMELVEKLLGGTSNSNVVLGDNNSVLVAGNSHAEVLALENKRLQDLLNSKESENQILKDLVASLKAQLAAKA